MKNRRPAPRDTILALRTDQWLTEWDTVKFSKPDLRGQPEPHFYVLSMPATVLRALSGIQRRSAKGGKARSADTGIQRRHDPKRSEEINRFVRFGYPWSELRADERKSHAYSDLRKPGWLPTSIIVNLLRPNDRRRDDSLDPADAIEIEAIAGFDKLVRVILPRGFHQEDWQPRGLPPIEVIDGQHRLWAFDQAEELSIELPMVAFHGLDVSWQAYLFFTINIKPKRINPSLAFDLYPLLRTQDWLEKMDALKVYREARAQELTEALWSHRLSPWYQRINMLGDPGSASVSQAAWIRSLLATFVKRFEGQGIKVGGLFGAPIDGLEPVLPWTRAQQAAFLIFAWREMLQAVEDSKANWARDLNQLATAADSASGNPAFFGRFSILNSDQGVRGFLSIINDLCFVAADKWQLASWRSDDIDVPLDSDAVSSLLKRLEKQPFAAQVTAITRRLADWDWRASAAPGLTEEERAIKAGFRGGTGYRELRRSLLRWLDHNRSPEIASAARIVLRRLKYPT